MYCFFKATVRSALDLSQSGSTRHDGHQPGLAHMSHAFWEESPAHLYTLFMPQSGHITHAPATLKNPKNSAPKFNGHCSTSNSLFTDQRVMKATNHGAQNKSKCK